MPYSKFQLAQDAISDARSTITNAPAAESFTPNGKPAKPFPGAPGNAAQKGARDNDTENAQRDQGSLPLEKHGGENARKGGMPAHLARMPREARLSMLMNIFSNIQRHRDAAEGDRRIAECILRHNGSAANAI